MGRRNKNRPPQEDGFRNKNQFRIPNNPPQILKREKGNNDPENIQTPLQDNYVE